MEPCRAGTSPGTLPLGGWDGFGGHRFPEAKMFARAQKRPRPLHRNDPDVGLSETSDENLLSARRDIQEPRIPAQGSKRDGLHGRQNVRQVGPWQVPPRRLDTLTIPPVVAYSPTIVGKDPVAELEWLTLVYDPPVQGANRVDVAAWRETDPYRPPAGPVEAPRLVSSFGRSGSTEPRRAAPSRRPSVAAHFRRAG